MGYIFILGHNPTLSVAEIVAFFERVNIKWKLVSLSSEVFCIKTEKEINVNQAQTQLGGTIKIGKLTQIDAQINADRCADVILENSPANKKIYFGFSFYKLDETISNRELKKISSKIQKLGMEIKKELKEKNYTSRWVTSKELTLSSVIVQKNKLLSQGTEILVLAGKNKICLGKTLTVQEFKEYSFRDYGRPRRDMLVGLIPPKLAKIMINLTKINFDQVILDPFCGFGTILAEAGLMGYQNLIGSDIDEKTLEGAKQNLKWLTKNFQFSIFNFQLLQSDIKELFKKLPPHSVDAIITEPYLGPPLKGNESKEKLQKLAKEIEKLYLASFNVFQKILKKGGKIVIIFPVYQDGQQKIYLKILPKLKEMGFQTIPLLPPNLIEHPTIKLENGSVLYFRLNQRVIRQVLTFLKK